MATKQLTRLNVALTATTGAFTKAMGGVVKDMQSVGRGLQNAIMGPIGLITGALAGGGFILGMKSAADRIDKLAKSADRLGVSTRSFAGFSLAAEEAGSSIETLSKGMLAMNRKFQEAVGGSDSAAKSFRDIGLSLDALTNKKPDEQVGLIADALNKLPTQGARAAAAMDIFGKSGAELVNTLALGSAGLEQATKDAEALGLAVSRIDAAKVEEANDAFGRIGKVGEGIFNSLTVALAPFVTAMSKMFTDWATGMGGMEQVGKNVVDFLVEMTGWVADLGRELYLMYLKGQLAFKFLALGATQLADDVIQVAQWIGIKFTALWRLIENGGVLVWEALKTGVTALKVPFYAFVEFASKELARLLENAAAVAFAFNDKLGSSILNMAFDIRKSTGGLINESVADLQKSAQATAVAFGNVGTATVNLFTGVKTKTSETIQSIKEELAKGIEEQAAQIAALQNSNLPSQTIDALVAKLRAEADARAKAKADEIAASQEMDATAKDVEKESWLEFYSWKQGEAEKDAAFHSRILSASLSNASSFFGNLSKLQDSHNKTAQRIGKIAAKAKIVSDTASAAMGAYSAMAAIPIVGPALGAAAAAAAIIAGGIQLGNVDSGTVGGASAGPVDTSTTNTGGIQQPNTQATQAIYVQGDYISTDALVKAFNEAKERGLIVPEVRRV